MVEGLESVDLSFKTSLSTRNLDYNFDVIKNELKRLLRNYGCSDKIFGKLNNAIMCSDNAFYMIETDNALKSCLKLSLINNNAILIRSSGERPNSFVCYNKELFESLAEKQSMAVAVKNFSVDVTHELIHVLTEPFYEGLEVTNEYSSAFSLARFEDFADISAAMLFVDGSFNDRLSRLCESVNFQSLHAKVSLSCFIVLGEQFFRDFLFVSEKNALNVIDMMKQVYPHTPKNVGEYKEMLASFVNNNRCNVTDEQVNLLKKINLIDEKMLVSSIDDLISRAAAHSQQNKGMNEIELDM